MERGAAPQEQVTSVRIGGREPAFQVRPDLDDAVADPPPPGLTVVHRRGAPGEVERSDDLAVVDQVVGTRDVADVRVGPGVHRRAFARRRDVAPRSSVPGSGMTQAPTTKPKS